MSTVLTVLKKELKRVFTDTRMVLGLILPGLLIYVIYSVMGGVMASSSEENNNNFSIYYVNKEEEPVDFFKSLPNINIDILSDVTEEEAISKVKNKDLDLIIKYEVDFKSKVDSYQMGDDIAPKVELFYNRASDKSYNVYKLYTELLDAYEKSLTNKFDINNSPDTIYDFGSDDEVVMSLISGLLPFILIIFLFTGVMSLCADSIAGEKERGTIATLLVTPVNRTLLVLGKVISLVIVAIISSVVSFLGLILSLPKLAGESISLSSYGFATLFITLLVVIVTVLLFTSLLTMVSSLAKSVKEASAYSTPLIIVVMMAGLSSLMSSGANSNTLMYLVPVYNSTQCLTQVFSMNVNYLQLTLTVISNICYVGLGIFLITKMFSNEKIMFN